MRSLSLLSGGEKCLTAMALLFAIFEVKSSPFCLLDEIDAPLDDSNVERFVNMVRNYTDRSQFIIVTHNKSTMAIADRLYGVSMQEKGVSKLLSIEFSKEEEKELVLQ
jgi:chromosome segregation protein